VDHVAHAPRGVDEYRAVPVPFEGHSRNYYRALAPLAMQPLRLNAPHIIVPPGIEVSGQLGDTQLYEWDAVEQPQPRRWLGVLLFPSTQALLESELGVTADMLIAERRYDA